MNISEEPSCIHLGKAIGPRTRAVLESASSFKYHMLLTVATQATNPEVIKQGLDPKVYSSWVSEYVNGICDLQYSSCYEEAWRLDFEELQAVALRDAHNISGKDTLN